MQWLIRVLLGSMTGLLILPVVVILTMLVYKGGPAISFEFLFASPTKGMTAGGIFPALLGTILLVLVALMASVPPGYRCCHLSQRIRAGQWVHPGH